MDIEAPLFGSAWVQRCVVVVIALVIALRAVYLLDAAWVFSTDDAYITLRYARQLAEGQGIVWNVGEAPVEGYSNFIFVILGAVAIKLGVDPILFLKGLSCLALATSCLLLYRLTRAWTGPMAALLPALFLSTYMGTIWWAVSGLETAVYQMIVLAAIVVFFRALQLSGRAAIDCDTVSGGSILPPAAWYSLAGLLVFLASLTRPEAPLIGVAMGAGLLLDIAQRTRAKVRTCGNHAAVDELRYGVTMACVLALSFALPYALYTIWRLDYFGRWLPNTVYCKADYSGDPLVLIKAFWWSALPAFVFATAALWRRFDPRLIVMGLVVLLYVGVLYGVDPIIGHLNRHFLTAYALLLVLATVGGLRLLTSILPKLSASYLELGLLVTVLAFTSTSFKEQQDFLQERAEKYADRMTMRAGLGHWLNNRLDPDETILLGDVGMIPFVARANVMDAFCLNSRVMTSPPINNSAPAFVEYAMEQEPEMVIVHSRYAKQLEPRTELNIYPLIVQHPAFISEYEHRFTTGYGAFHYWVFERRNREGDR